MNITQEGEEQSKYYSTMTEEKLMEVLNNTFEFRNNEVQIFTGEGGLDKFDVEMMLQDCKSREDVENLYRKLRDDHFILERKYRQAIRPWYKKFYYWLRNKLRR